MANRLQNIPDYPVFRTGAEIEAFFLRAEPFIDSTRLQVELDLGPDLSRLGSFRRLLETAGDLGATYEILGELERETFGAGNGLPHLALLPSGWVALLRHPDAGADGGTARIRLMICPAEPEDGERICASLAQLLLSLQDAVGGDSSRRRKTPPLPGRNEAAWPEALQPLFSRDTLEEAYIALLAQRGTDEDSRPRPSRSDLIDQYLRWLAASRPTGDALGRDHRAARGPALVPAEPVDLKHHVINMRFGELSQDGQFQTSPSDVATIAERARAWIGAGRDRRLAIYAHGGLVSERKAIEYARATAPWWIGNGVYPVFCVWESDALTTFLQLIRETLGGIRRGPFDLDEMRDAAVQRLVHMLGTPVWDGMKRSARRCSAPGNQHGLTLFLAELKRAFGNKPPPLDLVGHSAGSILLLHLLPRLKAAGLPARSFQSLAPAATTALFRAGLAGQAGDKLACRIYTMTDAAERDDNVARIYGKSLLYLISRGFEPVFGETISGLQKDLLADPVMLSQLTEWSGGVTREALVFSPTPADAPRRLQSRSETHGGFDNDPATMWSVMRFIRGPGDEDRITPFPADAVAGQRGGAGEMDMDLPEEVRTYLTVARGGGGAGAAPPASVIATASAVPASARQPARLALTIGIDEYASASRLQGCVRDSGTWRDLLAERGFDVTQFIRPEETGRDQLIRHLRDFVARGAAGDTLVWHFSGHGMEIMPEFGSSSDFETTGRDQAIVASNASEKLDAQVAHALIDDDLFTILQEVHPQTSLYVFLDSCYSGSATRLSLPGRPRTMGTLQRAGYVPHRHTLTAPSARSDNVYEGARHVLFSAASATQPALENGAPPEGVFTRAVREVLGSRPGPMTNSEFRLRLRNQITGNDQTPGLHCDAALFNQPFPLA